MATDQTANLALPYLAAAQAQKHVTHNEALRRLDAYTQLVLESVSTPAPPSSPAAGGCWFVPAGASGAFAGQSGKLAAYEAGVFDFLTVPDQCLAYVRDRARLARFDGSKWVSLDTELGAPLVLESVSATAPTSLTEGAVWHVPASPTGAFAGHAGQLAIREGGAFSFIAPATGALAFIRDAFRLAVYDGMAWVSPLATRPTGAAIEAEVLEEDLVLSGSSIDTSVMIPNRGIVLSVSTRVLSEISGATSFGCGIAGETTKFGSGLGLALGASNSGVIGPTAFYAATAVRLSANGGVFTGGRVRVSIHLLRCPASAFPERDARWWEEADHLLDAAAPVMAADFVRERYALGGAHVSAAQILQRTGGTKVVAASNGVLYTAPANAPAYDHVNGHRRLIVEGAATNRFLGSLVPTSAQALSVTAQVYTVSFWGTGTLTLSGAASASVGGTATGVRTSYSFTPSAGTLTITPSGAVTRVQLETGPIATSYMETTTAAVTRVTDVVTLADGVAAAIGPTGTLAWRGRRRIDLNQATIFMTGTSNTRLLAINNQTIAGRAPGPESGSSSYVNVAVDAAEVGACWGWDSAGTQMAANGILSSNQPLSVPGGTPSAFFIGRNTGAEAGVRLEVDEMLLWSAKGSGAEIQAQARLWA